jgi:hypothetical protein
MRGDRVDKILPGESLPHQSPERIRKNNNDRIDFVMRNLRRQFFQGHALLMNDFKSERKPIALRQTAIVRLTFLSLGQ